MKAENLACQHLVAFGGHNRAKIGRKLCADALREARRTGGPERAKWLRRHFCFITGHLPVKHAIARAEGRQ